MKMRKSGSILCLTILSLSALAKPVPSRGLELEVIYGEKHSFFRVTQENNGGSLAFHSSDGTNAKKVFTPKDFEDLSSMVRKIPMKQEASGCERQRMWATLTEPGQKTITLTACLFGQTPTAKGLQSVANLLSAIL
jgi:hypothetical protein